jgi:hypothetical protein
VRRESGNFTSFILFKSQFSEEERKEVARSDDSFEIADDTRPSTHTEHDYENVWRWFLHRQIASMLQRTGTCPVERDEHLHRYIACVTAAEHKGERSGIRRLFPKFTKGQIEISKAPSLKLDFEWADAQKTKVSFTALVRQADALFEQLRPTAGSFYIFVDELELKLGSKKQYESDSRMIRDLIVTAHKMNQASQQNNRWLKVICAVRSEVLSAVVDFGKEIEKPLFDFGRDLSWYQAIRENSLHLLLQLVCHKIQRTEAEVGIRSNEDPYVIWSRYFKNNDRPMEQKFLLHRTWFRPRDLVRILTLARDRDPNRTFFFEGNY